MESCECALAGFCNRRQATMPKLHWKHCQNGLIAQMDELYIGVEPAQNVTSGASAAGPVTGSYNFPKPKKSCGRCKKHRHGSVD